MSRRTVLAADIGAGSGRIIAGSCENGKISLAEVYRFTHELREISGSLCWDYPLIESEVRKGIRMGLARFPGAEAVGVDSFCPDYCTVNADGSMAGPVLSYRNFMDGRALEEVLEIADEERFFRLTGTRPIAIGLLPQLFRQLKTDEALRRGERRILPLPNRLQERLGGRACTDYTQASVSMLYDKHRRRWSGELCGLFGIPEKILPEVVPGGCVLGTTGGRFDRELKVVQTGTHDTAAAAYCLALLHPEAVCINIGTWTFAGVRRDARSVPPHFPESGLQCYGLPDETDFYCRTIPGTWYLQEIRRGFAREGRELTFGELSEMAAGAELPSSVRLNLSEEGFQLPGGVLPQTIRKRVLAEFGLRLSDGQTARLVYEYLWEEYAGVIRKLDELFDRHFPELAVGGGGSRDPFLMRLLRERSGRRVCVSPQEVTAMGNVMMQFSALGVEIDTSSVF